LAERHSHLQLAEEDQLEGAFHPDAQTHNDYDGGEAFLLPAFFR
jgi:hypothetical protein